MFKSKRITNIWLSKYHQNFSYHFPSIFGTTCLDQLCVSASHPTTHAAHAAVYGSCDKPLETYTNQGPRPKRCTGVWWTKCQMRMPIQRSPWKGDLFHQWPSMVRWILLGLPNGIFFDQRNCSGFLDMQPLRKQWCSLVGMLVEIGIFYRTM